ncbi:hypothetical protein GGQ73_000437 [Rhizobium skierniewicense]|uniref:Uncharacterized protein n=1 Tax=Rhizobium skierniewicense TaxID=984260 RepID=A0A7W6C4W8_9HYPH|nr:hypothetical protein [Rhizobium skierniewicense]MBB3944514.1 hypothetical protein [Rhizobium skierniewicense]
MAAGQVNCRAAAVVSSHDVIFQHNDIATEFPGVSALDDATFNLRQDKTRAVLSKNRAGRLLLIKDGGRGGILTAITVHILLKVIDKTEAKSVLTRWINPRRPSRSGRRLA